MLKDRPHLCRYMPRCKNARRIVADPDNEPNFYNIGQLFPLEEVNKANAAKTIATNKQPNVVKTSSVPQVMMAPPSITPINTVSSVPAVNHNTTLPAWTCTDPLLELASRLSSVMPTPAALPPPPQGSQALLIAALRDALLGSRNSTTSQQQQHVMAAPPMPPRLVTKPPLALPRPPTLPAASEMALLRYALAVKQQQQQQQQMESLRQVETLRLALGGRHY